MLKSVRYRSLPRQRRWRSIAAAKAAITLAPQLLVRRLRSSRRFPVVRRRRISSKRVGLKSVRTAAAAVVRAAAPAQRVCEGRRSLSGAQRSVHLIHHRCAAGLRRARPRSPRTRKHGQVPVIPTRRRCARQCRRPVRRTRPLRMRVARGARLRRRDAERGRPGSLRMTVGGDG
jgi:hypothetical protein